LTISAIIIERNTQCSNPEIIDFLYGATVEYSVGGKALQVTRVTHDYITFFK